jgi:mannonate dehydratase
VDEVERYRAMGYLAIRAQSGVPGLKSTYGVAKDQQYYEPAERGLPSESLWSTEKYLRHVPKLFEALRSTLGDDLHLLHDVHHRLTPIEAARLGKELEPYHLFWLEDPVAAEVQESFRLIRQHTTTPLAVGEVFNTLWDAEQLIREQLIDYLRMSVVHGGGLTAMKKAADFAALYHVQTGCHGASDMSPVCMAAALHLGIAINNFGIQEHMLHNAQTEETFAHAYAFREGFMYPGDTPGLGVDIREDIAAKFPYQRAYLPVNRKEDGTLFHW